MPSKKAPGPTAVNVVKLATAPPGKKMNEAHLEQGTVLDALFFELRA